MAILMEQFKEVESIMESEAKKEEKTKKPVCEVGFDSLFSDLEEQIEKSKKIAKKQAGDVKPSDDSSLKLKQQVDELKKTAGVLRGMAKMREEKINNEKFQSAKTIKEVLEIFEILDLKTKEEAVKKIGELLKGKDYSIKEENIKKILTISSATLNKLKEEIVKKLLKKTNTSEELKEIEDNTIGFSDLINKKRKEIKKEKEKKEKERIAQQQPVAV